MKIIISSMPARPRIKVVNYGKNKTAPMYSYTPGVGVYKIGCACKLSCIQASILDGGNPVTNSVLILSGNATEYQSSCNYSGGNP